MMGLSSELARVRNSRSWRAQVVEGERAPGQFPASRACRFPPRPNLEVNPALQQHAEPGLGERFLHPRRGIGAAGGLDGEGFAGLEGENIDDAEQVARDEALRQALL